MKIVKIGTFDKNGNPTGWEMDPTETTDRVHDSKSIKIEYALGIVDDKIFVNGVEIVEWTEKRLRLMDK